MRNLQISAAAGWTSYARQTLGAVLLSVLSACGGGGGGGGADSSGTIKTPVEALQVNVVTPMNGADNVDPRTDIYVTFSAAVSANSLSTSTVQLSDGVNTVPFTATVEDSGRVKIVPASALKLGSTYSLTIGQGVKALSGAQMQSNYTAAFKTARVVFDMKTAVPSDTTLWGARKPLIAVADLNRDGRPDIVELGRLSPAAPTASEGYRLTVYLQTASGNFEKSQTLDYVLPSSGFTTEIAKIALLDVDTDGVPELIVPESNSASGLRIFKQDAHGQYFAWDFLATEYTRSFAMLDVDGDGRPDLIGGLYYGTPGMQVFFNRSAGLSPAKPVAMPANSFGYEFAVADLNHDGQRQIVVLSEVSGVNARSTVSAFTIDSAGDVVPHTALTSLLEPVCATYIFCQSMAVLDIDSDGWPDLVFGNVAISGTPLTVSLSFKRKPGEGYGLGFQTQFGTGAAVLNVADVNRDGLDDLLILDNTNYYFVAAALGKRANDLEYTPTYRLPDFLTLTQGCVVIFDMNGDGLPDVLVDGENTGITIAMQFKP
jgi:hypothetical protein